MERSPAAFSTWLTTVPGGMASSGRILPGISWAATESRRRNGEQSGAGGGGGRGGGQRPASHHAPRTAAYACGMPRRWASGGGERTILAAVDELASVGALGGSPLVVVLLVLVRVVELHLHNRGATAGIVDQIPDNTAHVAVPLGVVEGAQLHRTLAVLGVRGEDRPATLPLPTDNTTCTSARAVAVRGRGVALSYALNKCVNGARFGR